LTAHGGLLLLPYEAEERETARGAFVAEASEQKWYGMKRIAQDQAGE
jgi:hypothetical protein